MAGLPRWLRILLPMQETWVRSLGWEDPLEVGMATQFSILAWRIPQTEEPGSYSPWGCKKSDTIEVTEHARTHSRTCMAAIRYTG